MTATEVATATQLESLDRAFLTHAVRRALRRDDVGVRRWEVKPINYPIVNSVSGGLYRLSGAADTTTGEEMVPWTLVLKIIRSPSGRVGHDGKPVPEGTATEPSGANYWKREALAYQSSLLGNPAQGLAAPHCYAVVEQPDDSFWLWLEDVQGEPGASWPLSRYGLAARHLGRFNGRYLASAPSPVEPWLSQRFLRRWVEGGLQTALADANVAMLNRLETWQHPLVRRAYPSPSSEQILALVRGVPQRVAAVEALPQTLCHQDFYSRNLIARRTTTGDEQTVAVDWAFIGVAGVGEDAGQLVGATAIFGDVAPERFRSLDQYVFEGYLDGLRDAGWAGDWRLARLGAIAHASSRFASFASRAVVIALDERLHARWIQLLKRPVGDIVENMDHFARFMIDLAAETRHLQHSLEVDPART
jgi:hypothetical protein